MSKEEEAKAKAEAEETARQEAEATEAATKAETEAAEAATVAAAAEAAKSTEVPGKGKGESKKEPSVQELQQTISTTQGLLKQAQSDVSELRKQGQDFEGLRQTIDTQGQTLELITDVLGSMAEGNEELQTKVAKSRQEIEQKTEKQKKAQETFRQMGNIAQIAGLQPTDESLKPAFEALQKGDHAQAVSLTTIAVQAKVSSAEFKKPAEAQTPEDKAKAAEAAKKKLPVHTGSATTPSDWREQSPKEKILGGLQEHREES